MASDDHTVTSTIGSTVRIVVVVALIVALAAFVLANSQSTTVDFLFTEADAPLIAVLAGTALIGGIVVELLRSRVHHR